MKSLENEVRIYSPVDLKFLNEKGPLTNEGVRETLKVTNMAAPAMMFAHPSGQLIVSSLSFLRFFPYIPLEYPIEFQKFVYLYCRDDPDYLLGP
jgi:hypothetical protein